MLCLPESKLHNQDDLFLYFLTMSRNNRVATDGYKVDEANVDTCTSVESSNQWIWAQ